MTATFAELITGAEVELEQLKRDRERCQEEIRTIAARAKREGRARLTVDEDNDIEAAKTRRERLDGDIVGAEHKLTNWRDAEAAEKRNEERLREIHADPQTSQARKPAYDQVARVGREERTYHRGNSGGGGLFLKDVVRQFAFRDMDAETRLARHMQEERVERGPQLQRASDTSNFSGLVVPQYLTDMYAPKARALRPFADVCNHHDLPPDGMTVNISLITTGTAVGLQTSQNASTGIGATDIDDTLLTINVLTAAGTATLSRQAIERGTGIEDVTMSDMQRAFSTNLDSTLLNQATTGLTNVATGVTYDDTSPTGVEMYPKLLGAAAGSEALFLGQAITDFAVMHSRRWFWLSSQMTSTWPLVQQPGIPPAAQTIGENAGVGYGRGIRGILPNGLQVVVDNNVATNLGAGTNQDEVYIIASDECHLWEQPEAPQFIRAEQPTAGTLGVQLVLYGYYAYTHNRYSGAQSKVSGTGLVTPTF
jgi:hypothetical protein